MTLSRQRRWQLRQVEAGNCEVCGQPRGSDGTERMCRVHAVKASQRSTGRRQHRPEVLWAQPDREECE